MPIALLAISALQALGTPLSGGLAQSFPEDEARWIRDHVGAYIWPAHGLGDYDYSIDEQSAIAERLGLRVVRVIFEPQRWGYAGLVELAQAPEYARVFARFPTVVLTMPRWDPQEPGEFAETERAYAEFTRYLLARYRAEQKAFILGFWEGDNALMSGEPAVRWCRARHRGIQAGRAAAGPAVARVLEMVECNYDGVSPLPPDKAFTAESCMARTVIPHTAADLYSFSAWMDLPPAPYRSLPSALDALAAAAPDGAAFGARNVMLGEAGLYDPFFGPEEKPEAARGVISAARGWGAPYVIWWWLSGHDLGLVDARFYGGGRSDLWYPFWAAYHGADDPFVVDDFDEADLAPGGGLRNHLGGAHTAVSSHGAHRLQMTSETDDRGSFLRVRPLAGLAPNELAEWRTELGCFDARQYRVLQIPLRFGESPQVGLWDVHGHRHWLHWQERVTLSAFAARGIDTTRLSGIGLRLASRTGQQGIGVAGIAFARETRPMPHAVAKGHHIAAPVAGLHPEILPGGPHGSSVVRFGLQVAEESPIVQLPRLNAGGRELRLVDQAPPGSRTWIEPGGAGGFDFGAPFRSRRLADIDRCGFVRQALRWEPEYRVLMCEKPRSAGYLELAIGSAHPIRSGEFVIEGRKAGSAAWGVTVFQGDQAYEAESTGTLGWVDRELFRLPADWPPARWIRLRFWLRIDRDSPDWVWDGSISFVGARLALDGSGAEPLVCGPDLPLVYGDRESADAARLVTVLLSDAAHP